MRQIYSAASIAILFLAVSFLAGEEATPEIATIPITFDAPAEVRGKHYYKIDYGTPITIDELSAIALAAEREFLRSAGFKSDLMITVRNGTTRRRRVDGGKQRANSRYNITIQNIEKYHADGRPFASTMGLGVELDDAFEVIPW